MTREEGSTNVFEGAKDSYKTVEQVRKYNNIIQLHRSWKYINK